MFFHQWIVSNTHICVCQRSNLQSELNASYEAIKKQFSHPKSPNSQAFDCGGRLRNLRVDCFNEGLYCVTATWQQVFKGLLQVTGAGFCRIWLLNAYTCLAVNAARQWLLMAANPVVFILYERKHGRKINIAANKAQLTLTVTYEISLWCGKGKTFCEPWSTLHRQQLEKVK